MSQFILLRRNCPICLGARRDCRENSQSNLIHCRHDAAGTVSGFQFVGQDAIGFNMWAVDDGYSRNSAGWETQRQQRAADQERRLKKELEHFAQSLTADERDRNIRKIHAQVGLSNRHWQDLRKRGLTDAEIESGKFFSIAPWQEVRGINPQLAGVDLDGRKLLISKSGFACPIWDVQECIIGWQTRFDDATDNKYKWPKSQSENRPNGATAHLQNGELPISCCRPLDGEIKRNSIGLAEGFLKPYIAAQRQKQIVIGAAGGNFASSPQQLKADLDALSAELNTKTVDFYPDAGAVTNKSVIGHYERTIQALQGWGYTVRIAWWGQINKSQADIDELQNSDEIAYLSPAEFLKLADQEQYRREVAKAQAKLSKLTYKPDILLDAEYLPSDLWSKLLESGILNIKGRKGCGKSTLLKQLIKHYKTQKRKVLSITPRIALGREQAFKWDICWIDKCGVQGNYSLSVDLLAQEKALGLCWDSLWKVTGQDWSRAVIIIDESELGLKHLATSSTCEERRALILVEFAKLIQQVLSTDGLVILSDADLTDVSVDYLKAFASPDTPIFTVINTHNGPAWDIEFYTGERGDIENQILDNLELGLKTAIATDSQAEGEALERKILEYEPSAKVIRIDRKTTSEDFGREFVKNPNGSIRALRPDVLIYSPSMGTGVSIDEPHFDEVIGMFFGALEPSEARQMLARVRAPIPRVVWCKDANYDIPGCKSSLPSVVKKQMFKFHKNTSLNLLDLATVLAGSEDDATVLDTLNRLWDQEKQEWSSPHLDLYANVKARRNFGLSQLAMQLRQELLNEGHEIQVFEGGKTAFSDEITNAKREIKQEEAAAIANAKEIDTDKARAILNNPTSNEADRHKAYRAVLADNLPGVQLTKDFVYKAAIADRGRWLAHHRLFWMLSNPEKARILDKKQWHWHLQKPLVYLPDIHTYSLQVKVLRDLEILDLIDPAREYCTNDQDVQRFLSLAIFMRHRLKTAFDLTVTEKSDPIALLGRLFERIGLELHNTRRLGPRGQQVRYYGINQSSFTDPDRLAVLDALTRKYANLTDDFDSQKSASCNNTTKVMATRNGSQRSPDYINNEVVVATEDKGSQKSPICNNSSQVLATAQKSTWGVGLLLPGSIVQCFGRAGCWTIKYCTGVVAKIVDWYGHEEIVSCEYLRSAEVTA